MTWIAYPWAGATEIKVLAGDSIVEANAPNMYENLRQDLGFAHGTVASIGVPSIGLAGLRTQLNAELETISAKTGKPYTVFLEQEWANVRGTSSGAAYAAQFQTILNDRQAARLTGSKVIVWTPMAVGNTSNGDQNADGTTSAAGTSRLGYVSEVKQLANLYDNLQDVAADPNIGVVGAFPYANSAYPTTYSVEGIHPTEAGTVKLKNYAKAGFLAVSTPSAPRNVLPPAVTGTMTVGQTLTTTSGSWTGSPTGYAYQWYRDAAAINGATSSTYTLVTADQAATSGISCRVVATNTIGSSQAVASNVVSFTGTGPAFLRFTNISSNITESGSASVGFTYKSDGNSGYGTSTRSLPALTDGWIEVEVNAAGTSGDTILIGLEAGAGFTSESNLGSWAQITNNTVYAAAAGGGLGPTTQPTGGIAASDRLRYERVGSTGLVKYTKDNGQTYQTLATFTSFPTTLLYPVFRAKDAGNGAITRPRASASVA